MPARLWILLALTAALPGADREKAAELLERARASLAAASPPVQAAALLHLAETTYAIDAKKAPPLADRAFDAALLLPGDDRGNLAARLTGLLAEIDIEKSLAFAARLPSDGEERADAIHAVVKALLARKRSEAAIALIEAQAADGEYPYRAIEAVISALPAGDPAVASLLAHAVTAFAARPDRAAFADLLVKVRNRLPPEMLDSAASSLTASILAAKEEPGFVKTISGSKGAVRLHSRRDAELFTLLPVLREVAPKKLAEILESRLVLRSLAERYPDGPESLKAQPSELIAWNMAERDSAAGEMSISALTQQRQLEMIRLLEEGKSSQALETARTIPAPGVRASALAAVAEQAGNNENGQRILKLCLDELSAIKDAPAARVDARLLVARLAHEWKNPELASKSLRQAFDDAAAMVERDTDADNPNRAAREYWPSTQAARQVAHAAAAILGAEAEPLLAGITDPEHALLATIEMARGLLDLPGRSPVTATRFDK